MEGRNVPPAVFSWVGMRSFALVLPLSWHPGMVALGGDVRKEPRLTDGKAGWAGDGRKESRLTSGWILLRQKRPDECLKRIQPLTKRNIRIDDDFQLPVGQRTDLTRTSGRERNLDPFPVEPQAVRQ